MCSPRLPRTCTHDVPVSLIPRRLWPDYREPELSAFDVSVFLPADLRQLRHIAERYKNLGQHFALEASREVSDMPLGSVRPALKRKS